MGQRVADSLIFNSFILLPVGYDHPPNRFMQIRSFTVFFFGLALTVPSSLLLAEESPNQLTEHEKADGWKLLFDGKTTDGWRSFKKPGFPAKGWVVEDGWLHCLGKGGGDVISQG